MKAITNIHNMTEQEEKVYHALKLIARNYPSKPFARRTVSFNKYNILKKKYWVRIMVNNSEFLHSGFKSIDELVTYTRVTTRILKHQQWVIYLMEK